MLHAVIALIVQFLLGKLTGDWWLAAAGFSGFYLGREHAQAEYRWIERYGSGLRKNMPWYGPFQPRVWNLHSITDWLLPVIFTFTVAILV